MIGMSFVGGKDFLLGSLSFAAVLIAGNWSGAIANNTDRYPTPEEVGRLAQEFERNVIPSVQRSRQFGLGERSRQLDTFVRDWSKIDPEVAPFLGSWNKTVSDFMIYPSSSKGRACVVFTLPSRPSGKLDAFFAIASISNGYLQLKTNGWNNNFLGSGVTLIRNGNYLGIASVEQGKQNIRLQSAFSDPLRPIRALPLADTVQNQQVLQQFSDAGCTNSLPSNSQTQTSTQRKRDDLDNTLTSQQRNLLDSTGIKIFVPAYIPSGFQVHEVKTYRGGIASGYGIIYRDKTRDTCFAIESTTGGIGGRLGGEYTYSYPISTKLFGNTSVIFTSDSFLDMRRQNIPSEEQKRSPQKYLGTEWARNTSVSSSFYRLIGADFVGQSYYGARRNQPASICRNDITPLEAEKIMQSLRWLDESNSPSSTPVRTTDTIAKYPSNDEFKTFDSKLRGNSESLVKLRGNQAEQRRKFQNEWKTRNPNAAKFLGAWYTGDRYFYVFPSTVKGGTCVVTQDANGKLEMQVGTVLNRELRYSGGKGFFWRDRPNIIASRDSGTGNLYPIYATSGMPELSESMIGDMERQKCITTLPFEADDQYYKERGDKFAKLGNKDEAISNYRKALELLRKQNQFAQAKAIETQIIKLGGSIK